MPKEIIYKEHKVFIEEQPDGKEALEMHVPNTDGLQLQTRWRKGDNVVSVATLQGDPGSDLDIGISDGWWVDLTEDEIAAYIKILQRAARQTFGGRPW